jgi:hypothetical protein
MRRMCHVEYASIGTEESPDADGAYDLHDIEGTPEEIGKAIADSLKDADVYRGGSYSLIESGHELVLNLRIRLWIEEKPADPGYDEP